MGIKQLLMSAVLLVLLASCATQQERAERKAQRQEAVNEAVENRQWRIDVVSMNPMRYGARMVSPDFYLELKNDTLRSYLPYLGEVHRAPMSSPSKNLNFEEPVLRYQQTRKKDRLHQIEIDTRTDEDVYHYWIDLYDSGEATIRVRSNYHDPISFDGNMNE